MNFCKTVSLLVSVPLLFYPFSAAVTAESIGDSCNRELIAALTFDDGPDPRYTPEILDILEEYDLDATFFVIGANAEKYPALIEREVKDGFEIGNHTYSHSYCGKGNTALLLTETERAENVLTKLCGKRPVLFRPPGGILSGENEKALSQKGYIPVLWSVDPNDWKGPPAQKIAEEVLKNVKSGDIILCHDYVAGESHTAEAMRIFLPVLLERGFRFVTVSDLLSIKAGQ